MVRNPLDVCDTSLVLGLGQAQRSFRPSDLHRRQNPPFKPDPSLSHRPPLEPSLALRPPLDAYGSAPAKAFSPVATLARQQSSSHSTVSSFSKAGSEGAERASSRARDEEEEEEEGSARKKLRLTKEQSALLEDRFKEHSTLNPKQKQALAKQLSLRPRQVEVWFQNRRARTKMKQTEIDCEILRRCCETLTDDNRRLQKELRELKAITLGPLPPWLMQFPGAALAVCPSCERAAVAGDGSTVGAVATAKPQLYNPFTRPAAC